MFKLPGVFVSPFWKVVLVQSSVTEPAIRHAVLALSSFHCSIVLDRESLKPHDENKLTLEQYNKAITSLCKKTCDAESVRVAVVACLVFVFLDYLRGRYQLARSHLEHGVRLWKAYQDKQLSSRRQVTNIDDWISSTLISLQLQSVMFGQYHALSTETFFLTRFKSDHFASVNEARASLDGILLDLYRLNAQYECSPHLRNANDSMWHDIQEELSDWLSRMIRFTAKSELDSLGRFACKLLRVYHAMGRILLETGHDEDRDAAFDNATCDFMFIIEQAFDIYKTAAQRNWHVDNKPGASKASRGISDIGTIPPLYFTALYCRDLKLRLQAMTMLDCMAHREGIWDADLAANIAGKVVQIEGTSVYTREKTEDSPELFTILENIEDEIEHPAASRVIRRVDVILPDEPDGIVRLKCLRAGSDGTDQLIVNDFDLRSEQWL